MKESLKNNFELSTEDKKYELLSNVVAGNIHDMWRKENYWDEEKSKYNERIKITTDTEWIKKHHGKTEVDIASTTYEDLPIDWQMENKASAEVAVNQIKEAVGKNTALNDDFIEKASVIIHKQWRKRNKNKPEELDIPYEQLPEIEKEKDQIVIKEAVREYEKSLIFSSD